MGDMSTARVYRDTALAGLAGDAIWHASSLVLRHAHRAFRRQRPAGAGFTLRPGKATPLWNELRAQLRPHLRKYGEQANLGRLLGLPRQRVNAFLTGGHQMPDAERTLQLLVWLAAVRDGTRPG